MHRGRCVISAGLQDVLSVKYCQLVDTLHVTALEGPHCCYYSTVFKEFFQDLTHVHTHDHNYDSVTILSLDFHHPLALQGKCEQQPARCHSGMWVAMFYFLDWSRCVSPFPCLLLIVL